MPPQNSDEKVMQEAIATIGPLRSVAVLSYGPGMVTITNGVGACVPFAVCAARVLMPPRGSSTLVESSRATVVDSVRRKPMPFSAVHRGCCSH